MSLGKRLKKLRLEKDLSLQEFADIFKIGKTTVANYERDERKPDYEMITKFSEFHHVSTDYLLGKTDIKNPYQNIDRVDKALEDDEELMEFWGVMKERESLQLMFKQVKNMSDKDIKQVMRIIKAIEDEEAEE